MDLSQDEAEWQRFCALGEEFGSKTFDISDNQLGETNPVGHNSVSEDQPFYGSISPEMIAQIMDRVEEEFLRGAATTLLERVPSFSSIIDFGACESDDPNDQDGNDGIEQPRRELSYAQEDILPLRLHHQASELSELFNPNNLLISSIFDIDNVDSQRLLMEPESRQLDEGQLFMFDDQLSPKDFSSWFIFDSDDENEIALFKEEVFPSSQEGPTIKYFRSLKNKISIKNKDNLPMPVSDNQEAAPNVVNRIEYNFQDTITRTSTPDSKFDNLYRRTEKF